MSDLIRPQSTVLTAGTIVAHDKKFVGAKLREICRLGFGLIHFPPNLGVVQVVMQWHTFINFASVSGERPRIVGNTVRAVINVAFDLQVGDLQ